MVSVTAFFTVVARVDRMKEAKSESEEKILEYKRELEANYQKAVANVINSNAILSDYFPHH